MATDTYFQDAAPIPLLPVTKAQGDTYRYQRRRKGSEQLYPARRLVSLAAPSPLLPVTTVAPPPRPTASPEKRREVWGDYIWNVT